MCYPKLHSLELWFQKIKERGVSPPSTTYCLFYAILDIYKAWPKALRSPAVKKKKKNLLDQLGFSHSILACRLLEEYMLYCGLHPHLHGHVMNDLTHRWPEHESSREEVVLKPLLPRGATAARCSGCFTIMLLRYQIPRTLQRADLSGRSVVTTRSVKSRRTHLGARV